MSLSTLNYTAERGGDIAPLAFLGRWRDSSQGSKPSAMRTEFTRMTASESLLKAGHRGSWDSSHGWTGFSFPLWALLYYGSLWVFPKAWCFHSWLVLLLSSFSVRVCCWGAGPGQGGGRGGAGRGHPNPRQGALEDTWRQKYFESKMRQVPALLLDPASKWAQTTRANMQFH